MYILKLIIKYLFTILFTFLLLNQMLLLKSRIPTNKLTGIDKLFYKNNSRYHFITKNNSFDYEGLKEKMNHILDLKEFEYLKLDIQNGKKKIMEKDFILNNMILSSDDMKLEDFLENDYTKNYIWSLLYNNKDKTLHALFNHTTVSGILSTKLLYELNKQDFYNLKQIKFYPLMLEFSCILAWLKYYRMNTKNLVLNTDNPKLIKYKIPLIKDKKLGATVTINNLFKNLFFDSSNREIKNLNVANMFALKEKKSYNIINQQSFFIDAFNRDDNIDIISKKLLTNRNLMTAYAYLPFILNDYSMFQTKLDLCLSSIKMPKGYTLDYAYLPKSNWPLYVFNYFNGETIEGTILIKTEDINIEKLINNIKSYNGTSELMEMRFKSS